MSSTFQKRLLAWYRTHRRAMPWRGTRDPYRIWLSEVMLQQTRVAAVVGYYRRFLRRFPTVQALARARESEVLKHWAGLGYYSRARNLHRAAKEIVAKHNGRFPRTLDAALALPGVGAYTAAAVLSIAYRRPHAVLDGNVARVLARLFAIRGDLRQPRRWHTLQTLAGQFIMSQQASALRGAAAPWSAAACRRPAARSLLRAVGTTPPVKGRRNRASNLNPGDWNQAMMELGATVCTPRAPRCEACPIARWCRARKLGIANQLPAARRKRATAQVHIAAAVLLDPRGRTLLVPPNGTSHDGPFSRMWQFPAVEGAHGTLPRLQRQFQGPKSETLTQRPQRGAENAEAPAQFLALQAVKHTVTFREITLEPHLLRVAQLPRIRGGRTPRLAQLDSLAVSSATRKIARRALEYIGASGVEQRSRRA